MPKIPLAVVSTSSDDSGDSEDDLATDFRATNWTVVNMASMESFPFSEVSHQPYGMDSTFLDSVSHGSANLRTRNSTSGAQDMVSTSLRVSPQSPRPLFAQGPHSHVHPQGLLNGTHPRGGSNSTSVNTVGHHNLSLPSSKVRNNHGSPAAAAGLASTTGGSALRPSKYAAAEALTPKATAIPGAPPLSRRGRKTKPVSRRTRSLQVGAPRWRDSDGDMELLVRREVSKNGPVSPAVTEDYAVLSMDSSTSSAVLTPPPLSVEMATAAAEEQKKDSERRGSKGAAGAAAPEKLTTQKTTKKEAAATTASTGASDLPVKATDSSKKKSPHATSDGRIPLQHRRTSSPDGTTATNIMASAQRQPLSQMVSHDASGNDSKSANNSDKTSASKTTKTDKAARAPAPMKPAEVAAASPAASTSSPPHSVAPGLSSAKKTAGFSPLKAAGRATLAAARRMSPGKTKKKDSPKAVTAVASSEEPPQRRVSDGHAKDRQSAATTHAKLLDEEDTHERNASPSPPARRTKLHRSVEFSEGGGSSIERPFNSRSNTAVFPPVSAKSPTASVSGTGVLSAVPAPEDTSFDSSERPQSSRRDQRRRSGRARRSSLPSTTNTETNETTASSVETVVVKPTTRHPTLKPLVMSPDDAKPLHLPRLESSKSPDNVLHAPVPPSLSPQHLTTALVDTPLHPQRRAQSVTLSTEASPARRYSHPAISTTNTHANAAGAGGGAGAGSGGEESLNATKTASMNTLSTLLPDSPPTLRPQTREFNERAEKAFAATPSFVSPASRATAERLVTFVRAVSDPEVLHVIYDYLVEQQRTTPRYRLAATACAELLERKEELLKTQELTEGTTRSGSGNHNNGAEGNDDKVRRSDVFTHSTEAEPFTIDIKRPTAGGEEEEKKNNSTSASRAAELRRLLAEIAAEQEEKDTAEDPDADEFDDFNFFDTPYPTQSHFSFGQPTVSGVVSRVFAEGMLFKIKTAKGEYYFYNDTLQDVMMVRVQCVLRGNEVINERAMLAPVEGSKETEITIAVLPEETNFFMSGVSHLPHFMAKRVPVPPDYVSPSVTQALRKINGEINSVRKALGKWSRASDQNAFLKCCLKHHLKFTDLTFRPSAESLFRADCDAVAIPPVTWRRPEEYVYLPEVSQVRLFRGEISCFLVKQGELNNHTVVAAMAAVAQFPAHVRWMFRHPVSAHVGKMERAEGCYRVTLLHNGWWKTYVIDDYVPASQKGPLFASCAEDPRRLWVPLLEKAYAKCLGSYAATCVVDAMEAMGDFTGYPVRYLDPLWAAAKAKPTGPASRTLFAYINRVVRAGCTVLLFTPAATDAQSKNTMDLSRKRSSRLLPVKGVIPQFLPGHIYFLRDVAFYEELDLRMAQLKNPWTWETRNKMYREKKWKYTTWYDRPDISVSMVGSMLGSSGAVSATAISQKQAAAAAAAAKLEMSKEEQQANDRKGTMWVEWGEVLAAFAGGGVCYTLWNHHRYRARNAFVNGRPRFVLEVKARRKVDFFVTLSLETVSETLDNYGTVVAARPTPLYGTALSVVQRISKQSARVVSESCEDVECVAARRTYVVAKDVSMKLTVDPRVADGVAFVVPLLDPQAVEDMAAAAAAKAPGGGGGGGPASSSSLSHNNNTYSNSAAAGTAALAGSSASEVHFVLSIVSDAVAGDGEDLSISFVSMRRSSGVFADSTTPFDLESTSRVTAPYQICTEKGVLTLDGNRICDAESAQQQT